MFYFFVSKIPVINNPNDEHRLFKVFIVGSILYLILHAYFFSSPNSDFMDKYGKYLYYIWAGDLGLTGLLTKMNTSTLPTTTVPSTVTITEITKEAGNKESQSIKHNSLFVKAQKEKSQKEQLDDEIKAGAQQIEELENDEEHEANVLIAKEKEKNKDKMSETEIDLYK